jgi:hypothetical protein
VDAVTEAEWSSSQSPYTLVEFLNGKASDRKLRLIAVACCQRLRALFWDPCLVEAVQSAEAFADHRIRRATLTRVANQVERLPVPAEDTQPYWVKEAVQWTARTIPFFYGERIVEAAMRALADFPPQSRSVIQRRQRAERLAQAALLRCIVGNPFRPVAVDPAWLRWRDCATVHIAQAIYDERCFQDLPILADALEEAGCSDPDILGHCRGPGEHVRGCWVVDLLLGKG